MQLQTETVKNATDMSVSFGRGTSRCVQRPLYGTPRTTCTFRSDVPNIEPPVQHRTTTATSTHPETQASGRGCTSGGKPGKLSTGETVAPSLLSLLDQHMLFDRRAAFVWNFFMHAALAVGTIGFLFCILVVRCTVFVPVAPPSQLVRCNKAWTRASRRSQGTARHPKTVAKKNVLMNGSKAGIRPLPCRNVECRLH